MALERINFSSAKNKLTYPDFLEVQLKSFTEFFQLNTTPEQRRNEELYKVLWKISRFQIPRITLSSNSWITLLIHPGTQLMNV
jgi:hypothetical protein